MADITIRAAYASVVEDDEDGLLFIGFAEGEEEDEPYCLFRQPIGGGPVWFEVSDEDFGAEDAIEHIALHETGLEISIRVADAAKFGWATSISVLIGPDTEDADQALTALAEMMGATFAAA
ncbi:MAG: hypothetical protein ACK4MS_14125 [Paracoccaceae bacterium]